MYDREKNNHFYEKGHIKKNFVWNPKISIYKGEKKNEPSSKEDSDRSLVSLVFKIPGILETNEKKWFLNSGASIHMCNDDSSFHERENRNLYRTV